MRAVGGSDPFTATTIYAPASTDTIEYYKTKAFTISMKAPAMAGTYTTDWRMYRGATAFGATFKKSVKVIPLTLTRITITKPASKTNYYIGEKLDLTGLVVTGTYSNGVKKTLPITTANVTGFNSSKPVTGQVLTITYGGKTTSYKVNILPIAVKGIVVTGGSTVVTGNKLQLGTTVTPANATNKVIAWSVATLDGGTATISSTGLLTASAAGTVTVTATNAASGVKGTKVLMILPVDPVMLAAATAAVESLEAAVTQDLTVEANLLAAEEAVVTANTQTGKLPTVPERTALEGRIAAATAIVLRPGQRLTRQRSKLPGRRTPRRRSRYMKRPRSAPLPKLLMPKP